MLVFMFLTHLTQLDPSAEIVLPPMWALVLSTLLPLLPAMIVASESNDNRLRWVINGLATVVLAVGEVLMSDNPTIGKMVSTFIVLSMANLAGFNGLKHFNINEKVMPSMGLGKPLGQFTDTKTN